MPDLTIKVTTRSRESADKLEKQLQALGFKKIAETKTRITKIKRKEQYKNPDRELE